MSAGATGGFAPEPPVRLYGGWRLRRGIGLWGLDATSSAIVLGAVLVPMLLAAASPRWGAVSAPFAAATALVAALRLGGEPLTRHVRRRLQWVRATSRGRRSRRYGPNAPTPFVVPSGGAQGRGPAPLADLDLHVVTSSRREDFAVVHDQARGTLTVAVSCASSSAWLVDRDDADGWVSAWHSWLAGLGYLSAVRWVAVIVETAPEPGTALHDSVAARVDPAAPADVRTLLRDLVARAPAATAHVRTWVCVTFEAARLLGGGSAAGGSARVRHSRPDRVSSVEDVQAAAAEADRLMAGLESSLGACGVTVRGRATAEDLVEVAAVAYDPGYRGRGPVPSTRRAALGRGAHGWDHASPVAVEEGWDQLRHDSGTSVSWGWQEAPRQLVTSDVLSRLHSPGRYPKRVCLLYRPMPAADAARLLESEVNAADFRDAVRRAQRRDETARDVADREQARRAAREEAVGAGVVLVSVYVTTTVTDPEELADAVADVEARADQAKIRLRRLYGGQSVGFATTLPLGLHPVALTSASRRLGGRGRP